MFKEGCISLDISLKVDENSKAVCGAPSKKSKLRCPRVRDNAMDCLREMGYTEAQARGALQKSNGDPEAAIMFLLDNPDYVGSGTQKTPKEGSFGDSDYNITLQKRVY